ncbi:unnamed protein product [Brassica rapa]|uniref:Uncharacterized protein n=1 Tax=Brassica campestris TaxID=3711 RepID=A0A8D9CML1_BRACM|nr:unnamed protein product [Brassica rapa]
MATQKKIQTSSASNEKVTIQHFRPQHTTKLLLDPKHQLSGETMEFILADENMFDISKRICQQITRLGLLLQIEENKLRMSKRCYTLKLRVSDIVFTKSESYSFDFQHRQRFLFISSFVD